MMMMLYLLILFGDEIGSYCIEVMMTIDIDGIIGINDDDDVLCVYCWPSPNDMSY